MTQSPAMSSQGPRTLSLETLRSELVDWARSARSMSAPPVVVAGAYAMTSASPQETNELLNAEVSLADESKPDQDYRSAPAFLPCLSRCGRPGMRRVWPTLQVSRSGNEPLGSSVQRREFSWHADRPR